MHRSGLPVLRVSLSMSVDHLSRRVCLLSILLTYFQYSLHGLVETSLVAKFVGKLLTSDNHDRPVAKV